MAVDQATGDNTTTTPSNDEQAEVDATETTDKTLESDGNEPGTEEAESKQGDAEGEQGDTDKDADKADVTYDLKVPEGYEFAEGELEAITEKAKELGLSNEQAQSLVEMKADWSVKAQDEAEANLGKLAESWADEVRADKEFGGDKFDESLQDVKRAMDSFADDQLKTALEETGFGNHPQLFRFVARIGKALREDGHVAGDRGNSSPRTPASVMYPKKEDS